MPRTTVSPSYLTSLKSGDAATNSSIPTSRTTRRPNVKRYIFLFLGHAEGYRSSTDAASPRGHVLNGVSRKDLADWRRHAALASLDIQGAVSLPEGDSF